MTESEEPEKIELTKSGRKRRVSPKRALENEYDFEARLEANFIDLLPSEEIIRSLFNDVQIRAEHIIEKELGKFSADASAATLWQQNMEQERATGAAYALQLLSLLKTPGIMDFRRENFPDLTEKLGVMDFAADLIQNRPDVAAELMLIGILLGRQMIRMEVAHLEFIRKGGRGSMEGLVHEALQILFSKGNKKPSTPQIKSTIERLIQEKPQPAQKKAPKVPSDQIIRDHRKTFIPR